MKQYILFLSLIALVFVGCVNPTPEPEPNPTPQPGDTLPQSHPDPVGTIYYTESDEIFANPERGFLMQTYYESGDLSKSLTSNVVQTNRKHAQISLYLHSYYLTDYMESDIAPEFLERMQKNFNALRAGGSKAVIRYSYKSNENNSSKPWDATLDWMKRHIDQLKPYWEANTDVILCVQAGFIGVWGEWYYTTNFKMNPKTDEDYAPRWELLNYLLDAVPGDRQVSLRTPGFKMRYLQMHGGDVTPLTEMEAYQPNAKARLAAFNDCFLASSNDVGTYSSDAEREFWEEDSKYTFMGGETCGKCGYSTGENAIKQMAKYHWTYINSTYHKDVLNSWSADGSMDEIKRRLGYRFVLDKAFATQTPKVGELYQVTLSLRNVGFASLHNPRAVELVLVNKDNPEEKYVYPQTNLDPRFWEAGDTITTTIYGRLDEAMAGDYKVYLNMPDPYPTIHDNPLFSVRFANEDMWEETTGYNYLTDLILE